MATKLEERKALEKIKAIIAGLGEDSYVAAAFEGCANLVEENIDNDFMCSPMDYIRQNEKLRVERDEAVQAQHEAEQQLADAKQHVPSIDKLSDTMKLLVELLNRNEAEQQQAAETIVDLADNPSDIAFASAVKRHRACGARADKCDELIRYFKNL